MADVLDVFGFGTLPAGRGSIIGGFPAPGEISLGGTLGGIVTDLLQRFPLPIPRPRLPLPPGGKVPVPTPRGRIPIPVPIPDIFGIFNGDAGGACPGCCKGKHIAKTKDENDPSFGKCVTNRRMNSLNPRALRRATRRLKGFERAVKGTRKQLRSLAKI